MVTSEVILDRLSTIREQNQLTVEQCLENVAASGSFINRVDRHKLILDTKVLVANYILLYVEELINQINRNNHEAESIIKQKVGQIQQYLLSSRPIGWELNAFDTGYKQLEILALSKLYKCLMEII